MGYFLDALKQYADFNGSMGRKPFWMFILFYIIFYVIAAVLDGLLGLNMILVGIYALALIIPMLAAEVRRLHDTGRSGWWILIAFVPVVGGLILLFFLVQPSKS